MFHTDDETLSPVVDCSDGGIPIRKQIVYGLLCIALVLGGLAFLSSMSGCGGDPAQRQAELQKWIDANNRVKAGIAATTQKSPEIEASIAAMSAGAAKDEASAAFAKTQAYLASAQKLNGDAGMILTAVQSGNAGAAIAAGTSALSGVPGVGPYAGLIGVLVGAGVAAWQAARKKEALALASEANDQAQANLDAANEAQGHLKNVVFSLEHGGPEWTPEHASQVAALQGPATTAAVNAIKSEIGIAYAHPVENTTAAN